MRSAIHAWRVRRFRHRVERALALQNRGEARPDGLALDFLRARLELRWTARDVHPWDRDHGGDRRRRIFTDQVLADTEAVIDRCFAALSEIDEIDLAVHDRDSGDTLVSGAVERRDWERGRQSASVRMRLRQLGVVPLSSLEVVRQDAG